MTHDWDNEDVSMRAMKYIQDFLFKANRNDQYFWWERLADNSK